MSKKLTLFLLLTQIFFYVDPIWLPLPLMIVSGDLTFDLQVSFWHKQLYHSYLSKA